VPYKPVEFGVPLSGFIIRFIEFEDHEVSSNDLHELVKRFEDSIRRVRVTVTDSFNGTHRFVSTPKEFTDQALLVEILERMGAEVSLAEGDLD
jgi:hypothetical protein